MDRLFRLTFRRGRPTASASRSDSGALYVVNSDGTDVRRLPESSGCNPVWSPDGNSLVYLVDDAHARTEGRTPPFRAIGRSIGSMLTGLIGVCLPAARSGTRPGHRTAGRSPTPIAARLVHDG